MKYLYHGSTTQNIKLLEPRKRYTPQGKIDYSAIYATPLPAYAATHSFPWSSDEGFDVEIAKEITLIVPKEYKDRINAPISIYKICSKGFQITQEEETKQTWHTTDTITVLEEYQYESVESAITHLGGRIKIV